MTDNIAVEVPRRINGATLAAAENYLLRRGLLMLLEIKDSDVRISIVEQCRDAVDKGLHAGGASSAVIPLVALFYGGFINLDIVDPTRRGQDMFVLSKGHAVATLASIYADLGYFDLQLLKNSRSYHSRLNGHPGPLLPGVHIATGPMGQGLSVAQGFAVAGRMNPHFDSFCMVGDGELQEGTIWEAVMYSGQKGLDNLCVLVDQNYGQLDVADHMVLPLPDLERVFTAFGWQARAMHTTQYDGIFSALEEFKHMPRNGKPTAIICQASKGHGSFSDFMNRHKIVASDSLIAQELALHDKLRGTRVQEFAAFFDSLEQRPQGQVIQDSLRAAAQRMHLVLGRDAGGELKIAANPGPVLTSRAPWREKRIQYDPALLPRLDRSKQYSSGEIITAAMKVFARDPAVISIDADLATTSGLKAGVGEVDQRRALNVGVAEANMMSLGEAFAALGYNTWISTFCPFWDWKVLRRSAVGHQERLEAIESAEGWLSAGHGLDLTLLSTASNFDTRTNGATHMGNDDITIFDGLAHLRIIDVSCPQQLLAIMKWIMEGNRGLIYLRVMRAPSAVLYDEDFKFEFGCGYPLRQTFQDEAVIISSGRGVHEALAAAAECTRRGLHVGAVDMPSIDEDLLLQLHESGKLICFAEQNNGYIWQNYLKILFRNRGITGCNVDRRILAINTLTAEGKPQFIHSGTYEELIDAFGLSPPKLAATLSSQLGASK